MADMGRDRGQVASGPTARPRRLRIATAGGAVCVTLVAVLGATGVLPIDGTADPAFAGPTQTTGAVPTDRLAITLNGSIMRALPPDPVPVRPPAETSSTPWLPERSGQGKRVVFDIGDQRVWLVSSKGKVRRTYPVSGSLTDNLGPGDYEVYSKSRHAVGVDDSGTMQYMVRFTQGEYAAIGFHDIPVREGEKVQATRQLGTPQSHGCIRQQRGDAKALWKFAPVGTSVVVLP